jgi:hypothetical protein
VPSGEKLNPLGSEKEAANPSLKPALPFPASVYTTMSVRAVEITVVFSLINDAGIRISLTA